MRRTYLDHAATTPTRPEVVKAMLPYRKKVMDHFKNPCNVGEIEHPTMWDMWPIQCGVILWGFILKPWMA